MNTQYLGFIYIFLEGYVSYPVLHLVYDLELDLVSDLEPDLV